VGKCKGNDFQAIPSENHLGIGIPKCLEFLGQ